MASTKPIAEVMGRRRDRSHHGREASSEPLETRRRISRAITMAAGLIAHVIRVRARARVSTAAIDSQCWTMRHFCRPAGRNRKRARNEGHRGRRLQTMTATVAQTPTTVKSQERRSDGAA